MAPIPDKKRGPLQRLREWFSLFDPDQEIRDIYQLDLDALRDSGVDTLVLDLENTLVEYKADGLPPEIVEFLDIARERGFRVGIVSNSLRSWVDDVLADHEIAYVGLAAKPRKGGFLRVLGALGSDPGTAAHVGDQVITDVYGAHRLGMRAILCQPIGPEGPPSTHIQRSLLLPLLNFARRVVG